MGHHRCGRQRDGIFFCIVGGTPLQGAELVGHAVPGGGMLSTKALSRRNCGARGNELPNLERELNADTGAWHKNFFHRHATASSSGRRRKIWRDLASGEAPSLASAMVSKAEALR